MRKLACLALLIGSISLVFAQRQKSALDSMVETEFAFAKMSVDQGTRPSFLAYIADDGILFRPGPVKGKQWMIDHPLPPSDKRPMLSWYPAVAEISSSGDMGWTTGPWEFKSDIKDAKPAGFGNFLTVWKKQPDGAWKFAIDLGVSNPEPNPKIEPWKSTPQRVQNVGGVAAKVTSSETPSLLSRDREFSAAAAKGVRQAFADYSAKEVRLLRNGEQPIVGRADAIASVEASTSAWSWDPTAGEASQWGDLGYTYGTYKRTKSGSNLKEEEKIESGNYLRIWKKEVSITEGRKWKVVADLLDPVAPKKN